MGMIEDRWRFSLSRRRALAEHTLRHRIEEIVATVEERSGR